MNGSVIGWVVLVGAAWCAAALGVAVTIGGVVRLRDRQVPPGDPRERSSARRPVVGIPSPRRAPESLPGALPVERDRELRGR
ncbi:hypothetical protein GCM10017691_56160 [Pseudonocardia petroleophila]|uniref:Uncharacterized protein n=1 Tax=Pseudonocardia petroleophila TaxID=37331 RepID=A0A7G7MNG2_9PSEU|nr:hypothetical protein [Pseudonocardia petroleophila]QNG54323.1 hypothetical protein H6H00_10760 [Pseudonocardia petroleophila]